VSVAAWPIRDDRAAGGPAARELRCLLNGCQLGCQRPRIEHRFGAFPCPLGPIPSVNGLVPEVRLELTRACAHRCLRPTRLPIPPLRHVAPSAGDVIIGTDARHRPEQYRHKDRTAP
jgi:hypothetical protein